MTDGDAHSERPERRERLELLLQGLAVALGSVLVVITSLNQPYNQNEWQQVAPYGNPDLGVATTGTRQPPLGPLLGVLAQRLLGDGHLEQRLVPMASGIGSLVLMVILLRRFRFGMAGVVAMFFMATAPVFVRYSAYSRPYALPMFLILLAVVLGTRWLDTGRLRWLAAAVVAALLLPLSRVPEPTVFLAAAAGVLGLAGVRGALPRARAWPLGAGFLVALVTVGAISALTLASKLGGEDSAVLDLHPGRAVGRIPTGLDELWSYVLPLYAAWFPWWPVTALLVVLGLLLGSARRRLMRLWFWWPLVLAPLAFLVAYHTVNEYPLDVRHYRIRFATFWIPPLVLLVAVVTRAVARSSRAAGAWLATLLAITLIAGQLPATARVLTENEAVDLALAGEVIQARVPENSLVLYDSAARTWMWRQPFFGRGRFVAGHARVVSVQSLAQGRRAIRGDQPVYLLLLDSECASSVVCDLAGLEWDGQVAGYERISTFDRFALYAPTLGQSGAAGVEAALLALVDAFGAEWAHPDAVAAARLMVARGNREQAAELVTRTCDSQPPGDVERCRDLTTEWGLGRLLG